jgi:hypothetical protein
MIDDSTTLNHHIVQSFRSGNRVEKDIQMVVEMDICILFLITPMFHINSHT